MKKFNLLSKIFVLFLSANSFAQGLEGIVVEKYYQANAADVAAHATNGAVTAPLITGATVYRVYANLATNYKLTNVWGDVTHPLTVSTTTKFFNDANGIDVMSGVSQNNWNTNTTALDSYLTIGQVAAGKQGVLKTEDTDGTILTSTSLLLNNPGGCFGSNINGLNGKDGMMTAANTAYSNLGVPTTNVFLHDFAQSSNGQTFTMNGGSLFSQNFTAGPTSTNHVLIGQFTTDGVLTFALNIQIKNMLTNAVEVYVPANPGSGEQAFSALALAANTAPTIASFTANPSGSGIITGTSVTISANNVQDNGSVSSVQFYNGTTLLTAGGSTNGVFGGTAPNYTYTFTPANGSYSITAKATDNECVSTTTSALTFTVAANQAPVITALAATTTTQFYPGQVVNLSCNAVDPENQTVTTTFSVNGGSPIASTASGSTFTATYTIPSNAASGSFSVTATAVDNYSTPASATSSAITFNVTQNTPPAVTVTSPTAGASLIASGNPATLSMTLTATATDANGIGSVVFYDNGTLLTTGTASNSGSTYTYVYTASPGQHTYYAKATDIYSAFTNSANVAVEIADPNALSYKVKNVTQNCDAVSYCMPVSVATTYNVANVIGYDISFKYNANKVTPTVNITLPNTANGLINPNFVESSVSWGAPVNGVGTVNVTLNLNGAAGSGVYFAGSGRDIFCLQFDKTAAFTAIDTAVFTDLSVQESYITGVSSKPGSNGSAISKKNTTYIGNLEFWSDNQAIKYDAANTNAYLKTEVKGSVSTTATASLASTSMTVTSATGVAAGMIVVANGVPVGTTVSSISGTTVTLSAATTAALSSAANPPSAVTFVNPATPVTPNTSGVFTHSLLNGQDLRIERDIDASTPVQILVNAADAVLAKTLLLNGNFTPSVFQIMALDVNLDGVISAGDVSQMKQRATLFIPEYRQAWNYTTAGTSNGQPSKDWVFVDVARLSLPAYQISSTFPANDATGYSKSKVPTAPFNLAANVQDYANCPIVGVETYKGIMLGDVNATYATFTANGLLKSENGAVVLDLASAVKEGNTFRIPVSFESTESTNALDFAVRFNENNVSFAELNNVAVGMEASSFMNEADRTFRFTGFDVANFTVGATVAELVLQSNNETISEKDIIADLALINGKPVDVKFEKSSEAIQSVFNVSIYPNPSNGAFSVQATENAIVDVYDMNGKQITASQVISSNGKVNIDLNNVEAGVYLVRVQNETFSTTKRIVIEK
ncbi:MAG: Ig-like domain-containing protein [Flavobacteriia bacterium]